MELWQQLQQAEMVPPELGQPPRALLGVPSPAEMASSTLSSPGEDALGASKSLQWIWEELGNLRKVDAQLLKELCHLGLELKMLREELAYLEEEEETIEEEEEEEEPEKQEEVPQNVSFFVPGYRLPDFEMTI
ncbi:glutamate-rich protein 4 [Suncus etruscus]|uniref:glutamate-rich protein 4 n=1 Tax=Suncus etruscus TaxID=109475 RepID=UPI00210FC310|nr:glutamate-rich protein 4 [Suncus etruscus]